MSNLNRHHPVMAGGLVAVTGEATVDTGLRTLQSLVCTLQTDNIVASEEGIVCWYPAVDDTGSTRKVVLRVEKLTGAIGDTAVNVSWFALGQ